MDSLKAFGYDITNKRVTDSIYYSLVCVSKPAAQQAPVSESSISTFDGYGGITDTTYTYTAKADSINLNGKELFRQNCSMCHSMSSAKITGPGMSGITERAPKGNWLFEFIKNNEKVIKKGDKYATQILNRNGYGAMTVFEGTLTDEQIQAIVSYITNSDIRNDGPSECEINPSRIHAIWNKKFNNTLLATKEFEERLQVIFQTCNASILELYVKNLDKKMYELDSIAMGMVPEDKPECWHKFESFYEKRKGGVSINQKHLQKLQNYIDEKKSIYNGASVNAIKKLYAK